MTSNDKTLIHILNIAKKTRTDGYKISFLRGGPRTLPCTKKGCRQLENLYYKEELNQQHDEAQKLEYLYMRQAQHTKILLHESKVT